MLCGWEFLSELNLQEINILFNAITILFVFYPKATLADAKWQTDSTTILLIFYYSIIFADTSLDPDLYPTNSPCTPVPGTSGNGQSIILCYTNLL